MPGRSGTQDRRSHPLTSVRTVHVDEVNQRGIRVGGEWINYSKWAKDVGPDVPGLDVEIEQDTSGFIRTLTAVNVDPADYEP